MARHPREVLRERFGFRDFRPGQLTLVEAVLRGEDALGVLPTGGGKSVCYQVPAVLLPGLTLVVTPLISLMDDQVARARGIGLVAAKWCAGQPSSERREVVTGTKSGALDVLFVSPERLGIAGFRQLLDQTQISLVAVDEAHCISQWGHDFRPAYRLVGSRTRHLGCPTLALTASATPEVRGDIVTNLHLSNPVTVVRSFDRRNLWWAVPHVRLVRDRVAHLRALLREGAGSAIVYAPTRRLVEAVRRDLAGHGVPTVAYHAGLDPVIRSETQERFMTGRVRTVVATNAFGMGIDKADVRTVVHTHLPGTLEAYYQEAGRAGRDGAPARCIAFAHRSDRAFARRLLDREGGGETVSQGTVDRSAGSVPYRATPPGDPSFAPLEAQRAATRSKLDAVHRFARTRKCRVTAVLRYFGEVRGEGCGRCDRCGWDYRAGIPH